VQADAHALEVSRGGRAAAIALLLVLAVPFEANAAVGAGGALPYEAWLTALRTSVTGGTAPYRYSWTGAPSAR
jgi:type IV secretory pathway VirB2 component (pilin)